MIPANDHEWSQGFDVGYGSIYWTRLGTAAVPQIPYGDLTKALDTTAPVLSSPTGTATGSTTASGTVVTTNDANGTLYYWATTNASETAADIKANGDSQAVTAQGVQAVSITGLTASTTYYIHYVHDDAAANESNVVSSGAFTTDASTTPVTSDREYLGGGAQGVAERRRKQREQDDQDFLDIITLALPEIMKHLK